MHERAFGQAGASSALNAPKNSGDGTRLPGTAIAAEPRYRNLADNALIVIADVSVDGEIIYANPAAVKMVEYDSLDEVRKKNIIDFWHRPEQRAAFISKLRQDGYVDNYEIEYLTKTGKIVYALGSAILDGDMISMVIVDISKRVQAEEERRESLALFDSYLSVAPVGMAIIDTDVRYVNINEKLAAINGVSIDDHLGKRPSEILPGRLGIRSVDQIREILRTSQPTINEEISGETLSQPGVTRHWLRSLFPMFGAHQEIKGVGVMVIEVTHTKNVEEQLRQSQKMEALGILSGGIAHDFNNLLYPITLNSELLLEDSDADSEEYQLLVDIVSSASKAKELISEILNFSRQSDSVNDTCDFTPVANDATKFARAALPESITIESTLDDVEIPVACESTQLYQVLVNLFTNAGQAISDDGVIKITLAAEEVEQFNCFDGTLLHGDFARFTMTDNGIGMDSETRAKMFDPFFTTRDSAHGTGLGLSTVFGIIQRHGGGISVSSTPGIGTTIEILLPLGDDLRDKPRHAEVDTRDFSDSENVLFVDDVASIRNSAKVCLGRSGYNVTTASSGQEALDIFLATPDHFNVVVTDQTMANMSGAYLSIELLKLRPGIPIVICTGHSDAISPESSKQLGIRAFLEKPVAPEELRRVVRKVLDEAGVRQTNS